MTDPVPEPTDDELVSAYVDGEVTDAERARVEGDPELQRRAEQVRAVAAAVAEEPQVLTDDVRDRLRTRALEVAIGIGTGEIDADTGEPAPRDDEGVTTGTTTAPLAPPDQLAARRRRRSRVPLPRPAVAAAVILVMLVLGLGLVFTGIKRDRADQAASTAADQPKTGAATTTDDNAAGEGQRSAASGGLDNQGATTTVATSAPPVPAFRAALGGFADDDALRARLGRVDPNTLELDPAQGPTTSADAATEARKVSRCDTALRSIPGRDLAEPIASASATIGARPVIVLSNPVLGVTPAKIQLSVLDEVTCQVLFAVER